MLHVSVDFLEGILVKDDGKFQNVTIGLAACVLALFCIVCAVMAMI